MPVDGKGTGGPPPEARCPRALILPDPRNSPPSLRVRARASPPHVPCLLCRFCQGSDIDPKPSSGSRSSPLSGGAPVSALEHPFFGLALNLPFMLVTSQRDC